jgi:membrane-associated phospholipid phosphatase
MHGNAAMKPSIDHKWRLASAMAWMAIGVVGLIDAGFALIGPLTLDLPSFLVPFGTAALLGAGGWYYRSIRHEPRIAAILACTAQIIAFASVGAPLSYIAAASGFPLQDATFDAWDRYLGVDWTQMTTFISLRPALQQVLSFAYASFALQTVTTVLALGAAGKLSRLATFIHAFIATTLVTIAISAVLPAAGPWLFLDLQPAAANGFLPTSSTSWPVFLGLRDGNLHTMYGLHSEGIITFPSLHAALGLLFSVALWGVHRLRWVALLLNVAMLMATPAYGGHYIVDVIAGLAVAAACWTVAARSAGAAQEKEMHKVMVVHETPSIVPEAPSPAKTSPVRENLNRRDRRLPAA